MAAVAAIIRSVLARVGVEDAGVSVAFVSDAVMRRLNRTYRRRDAVTDVLSFGALRLPSEDFLELAPTGELIIAPREAARRAKKQNISLKEEVTLLLVHGSLHLAGYDHERPEDAAVMFPLQKKILELQKRLRKI